jgi:hypothetical protein
MWKIVRAEIAYNWIRFAIFLGIVPLIHAGQARYETGYLNLAAFITLFLMVNGWNIRYVGEKRDYQLAQLPVSARRAAAARILMVLLPTAAFVGWYVALHIVFMPRVHINIRVPLMLWGLLVIAYSLAFIFRDRFVGTRAMMRGKMLLVAAGGALLILNVWTMLSVNRARAQGEPMPALVRIFEFVERHNPTTSDINMLAWLAVSFVLGCLTVETYTRRRSHV